MKRNHFIFHTVLAFILTLTIISVSVVFTLAFRPLYYLDISALNIPEQSGYSEEEIRENYDVLIDYNLSFGSERLEFPTLAMSEPGRIHFEEVRDIFNLFKYMAIAGVIVSIAGILFCIRRKEYKFLKLTSILAVALPTVLGTLVALNWDWAFVAFHHLAFNNDYWIFDPATDPVITILPDTFFLHCALMILGCVVLGSVICGLAYRSKSFRK
ncbi:TIGR01906 family membrane protein [bacterium 1XD21-13]|nr:TIGR01906 family membrane protein [bacterium 1XD21-13]